MPEFTRLLPNPITCAGLIRIHIPSAVAPTIQMVDSMVRVIRLRIRPNQPSQIAPRMTIVGMSGRQTPSRKAITTFSTVSVKLASNPSEVAAW